MPFGGQRRYDLAYEEAGRLVKVQCKSGRERKGAIVFRTYSVGRGPAKDYRQDVGVFGVYCHERGEIYLVPVDDVPPAVPVCAFAPRGTGSNRASGGRQSTFFPDTANLVERIVRAAPFWDDHPLLLPGRTIRGSAA